VTTVFGVNKKGAADPHCNEIRKSPMNIFYHLSEMSRVSNSKKKRQTKYAKGNKLGLRTSQA